MTPTPTGENESCMRRGSSKLFVGGISARTTTEVLRVHFSKYGRLVDAVVMSKNGRPRGFGFVTYDSPAPAMKALAEPQWLDGRLVDVKRAVPDERTQERSVGKNFAEEACAEDLAAYFAAGYGFGFPEQALMDQSMCLYLADMQESLCQFNLPSHPEACLSTPAPHQTRGRGQGRRAQRSSEWSWLSDHSAGEDGPRDRSPRSVVLPRSAISTAPPPPPPGLGDSSPGKAGLDAAPMKVEPAWLHSAAWVC